MLDVQVPPPQRLPILHNIPSIFLMIGESRDGGGSLVEMLHFTTVATCNSNGPLRSYLIRFCMYLYMIYMCALMSFKRYSLKSNEKILLHPDHVEQINLLLNNLE